MQHDGDASPRGVAPNEERKSLVERGDARHPIEGGDAVVKQNGEETGHEHFHHERL